MAFSVAGKLADILEDTQAAKFTDKLYVALENFQLALQKDKAKKRKVDERLAACDTLLLFKYTSGSTVVCSKNTPV